MNTLTHSIKRPVRQMRNWNAAKLVECDACGQYRMTVPDETHGNICASCCDAVYTAELESFSDAAEARITELDRDCWTYEGTVKNLLERAESAEAQLAELGRQEPIGAFHITDGEVEATTDYCAPGKFPIQNGMLEVYANPIPQAVSQSPAPTDRIVPVLPVRDEYGFWRHPNRIETPFDEVGTSTRIYEAWFAERGMAVDFTYMNQVFCDDCVYGENVQRPALHWNPESPYGDGWILTAIFDTEEGPCAEWVRYSSPAGDKGTE